MTTGERIRKIRLQRNLTQKAVAEQLGITRHFIGAIEQDYRYLPEIAEVLGVAIEELVPFPHEMDSLYSIIDGQALEIQHLRQKKTELTEANMGLTNQFVEQSASLRKKQAQLSEANRLIDKLNRDKEQARAELNRLLSRSWRQRVKDVFGLTRER
jgi:transcriptional regulator with XRE-family HTH domain